MLRTKREQKQKGDATLFSNKKGTLPFSLKKVASPFSKDLDDLKQLFKDVRDLDTDYLRRRLVELKLTIPDQIKQFVPDVLR
jgi:hypothetical protein